MKWEHKTTIYYHAVDVPVRIKGMEKDGWLFCGMAAHENLMVFARPVIKTRFEREDLKMLAYTATQQAHEVSHETDDRKFVAKTLQDCAQALRTQAGGNEDG